MTLRYTFLPLIGLLLAAAPHAQVNANRAVRAYAWANDATADSYTPDQTYSYNSSGGTTTATRSGIGVYNMTFQAVAGNGGHVQVSAYGSSAICTTSGWGSTPISIGVTCVDGVTRAPVDSRYTVLLMDATGFSARVSYAWADQASTATYTPSAPYSWDINGGVITATRSAVGTYSMAFGGTGETIGNRGTVLVSAYGSSATCSMAGWGGSALNADTNCSDGTAPVDTRYDILFVDAQGIGADGMGYAWANDPSADSYTPNAGYSFNASGGGITAARSAVGTYTMTFDNLAGATGGSVQVTSYGSGGGYCTVGGWSPNGSGLQIRVSCYDAAGAPSDSRYTVLMTQPDGVPFVASEETAEGTLSLTSSPNPVRGAARVTLTVPTARTMTVEVFDVLGRSVATLHDGPVAAGSLALSLDASALPSGVYHVRAIGETVRLSERLTVVR